MFWRTSSRHLAAWHKDEGVEYDALFFYERIDVFVNPTLKTQATRNSTDPLKIPTNYDFALINSNPGDKLPDYYLNESMIYKINGKPLRRLTNCKDTIILIYKNSFLHSSKVSFSPLGEVLCESYSVS